MNARIIRITTLLVCLICSCVLTIAGIWAATSQSLTCSTSVSYTPSIFAKIDVTVNDGTYSGTTTVFDNFHSGTFDKVFSNIKVTNGTNNKTLESLDSSYDITITVTNLTTGKTLNARISLDTTKSTQGVKIVDANGNVTSSPIAISTIDACSDKNSPPSATSLSFRLQSMFHDSTAVLKIDLETSLETPSDT